MTTEFDWKKQCEAEPLAYSGAIQPHGAIIYLDAGLCVCHVSAQIKEFISYEPESLLGLPLPEELSKLISPSINKLPEMEGSRSELLEVKFANDVFFDIVMTRGRQGILIEFFIQSEIEVSTTQHFDYIELPQNTHELSALHEHMAELIQQLTGFNRVMIYIFRDDGDGEVFAEARDANIYGSP